MPATNFTPIQLYRSTTASQVPTSGNLSDGELAINTNDEKLYFKNSGGTVKLLASSAGASGDVVGPASATDNAVVRFDGTTGKLVQNSVVTIADSTGDVAGVGAITMGGNLTLSGGTANGVLYLNGSKVATSGSALTFDGAILGVNGVSVGRGAGAVSTNTAVGASALAANTTGGSNTALGLQALLSNTTASNNTAVGYQALYSTTTVGNNTALGFQAGYSQTTANNIGSNTYIGYQAGYATTSEQNLMAGSLAGFANSTGKNHVLVGFKAGFNNTTGSNNTFVGNSAGQNVTTGSSNTFIGSGVLNVQDGSGSAMTTGSKNTILGNFTGNQGGLDIRTASNYIVLSDGDGNPRMYYSVAGTSWRMGNVPTNIDWVSSSSSGDTMPLITFPTRNDGTTNTSQSGSGVIQYFNDNNGAAPASVNFVRTAGTGGGVSSGSAVTFNATRNTYTPYGAYNNAEVARATGAGVISFANSGFDTAGIQFPASQLASSNANTLDDYEEGTWTCNYAGSTGSAGTYAASNTAGWYTKVGNIVTAWFRLILTDKGSWTGDVRITGLPFTVANPAGTFDGANAIGVGNVTFSGYVYTEPRRANTFIDVVNTTSGNGLASLQTTAISNNTALLGQVTYFV